MIAQLAAAGAGLVGISLVTGYKPVLGNNGLMLVKSVGSGGYMRPDAAKAFNRMAEAAAQGGVTLLAGSAFRSVLEQAELYRQYLFRLMAPPIVAKPGTSNHGNGTAVDVADAPGRSLTYSSAGYRWMTVNAGSYGFSWDEGSKVNEPWHWRFVG
jgi:D-alanyl-D-alanine carboxypeptidase